jgi:AraC-like DNA-binding protein
MLETTNNERQVPFWIYWSFFPNINLFSGIRVLYYSIMDPTAPLLSSFGRIQMHVLEEYGLNEKQVLAATGISKSFLDEPFYTYGDMFTLLDYGYSVAGGQYAIDICHYLWPIVLGPLGAAANRAPDIATACMLLLSHYKLIDPYNTFTLMPDSNGLEITVALPPDAQGHPRMLDFLLCATSLLYGLAMSIHPRSVSVGLRAMVVTFHGLERPPILPQWGTYHFTESESQWASVFIPQILAYKPSPYYSELDYRLATEMLLQVLALYGVSEQPMSDRLTSVLRAARCEPGAPLPTKASLLAMTGMSEEQINHKLKPDSTTLNKLWLSEASSRAAILFKQTDMTVREVNAVTLQYSDEAAFKKAYKRETGMTPSESKVLPSHQSLPPN